MIQLYFSIIDSLGWLISSSGFLNPCERWGGHKGNDVPTGYLTGVFDDRLWREWETKNGTSISRSAKKSSVYASINWFQPFDHTQYNVGVVYLVVLNLPRAMRFKPENVIIISTLPGPKEPDYNHLNPHLEPIVNDLLTLWQGVQFKNPPSIFSLALVKGAVAISLVTCLLQGNCVGFMASSLPPVWLFQVSQVVSRFF